MDVGRIARKKSATGRIGIDLTQTDREIGLPDHFGNVTAHRQQRQRFGHVGDAPEAAPRQRNDKKNAPAGFHEQIPLAVPERPVHADIGEAPGFRIALAGKAEAQGLAHGAVRAIAAKDVVGAEIGIRAARRQMGIDAVGILGKPDKLGFALDGNPTVVQGIFQNKFGIALRQRQHKIITTRQFREIDSCENFAPAPQVDVFDPEARPQQPRRHA